MKSLRTWFVILLQKLDNVLEVSKGRPISKTLFGLTRMNENFNSSVTDEQKGFSLLEYYFGVSFAESEFTYFTLPHIKIIGSTGGDGTHIALWTETEKDPAKCPIVILQPGSDPLVRMIARNFDEFVAFLLFYGRFNIFENEEVPSDEDFFAEYEEDGDETRANISVKVIDEIVKPVLGIKPKNDYKAYYQKLQEENEGFTSFCVIRKKCTTLHRRSLYRIGRAVNQKRVLKKI